MKQLSTHAWKSSAWFASASRVIRANSHGDLLMDSSHTYCRKSWLVHSHYGIGQIEGIEVKGISGADVRYFRIQATDCTYWVPADQMDSELMRPVCSLEEIRLVISILQRPPKEMSSDHNVRKNRIQLVQLRNIPEDVARLIRDLRARQRNKGKYNLDENNVIRTLRQRLVDEWSIVADKSEKEIASTLDALLDQKQLSEEII
jgi:CarD family transcriptional regulator